MNTKTNTSTSVCVRTSDIISTTLNDTTSSHDAQEGGSSTSHACSFISIVIVACWVLANSLVSLTLLSLQIGRFVWANVPGFVEMVLDVVAPVDMSSYDAWRSALKESI